MDSETLRADGGFLPDEKNLRLHQFTLSKSMPPSLVDNVFQSLSCKKIVTDYEGQVIRSQSTDLMKAAQLLKTLIWKGQTACQQFFQVLESLEPKLYERVTGFQARCCAVDKTYIQQERVSPDTRSMAPTYIVNIHNSTLTHCIIGSHNNQYINSDQQGQLPRGTEQVHPAEPAASAGSECSQKGAAQTTSPPTSFQLHSSTLEYVIIGDMNNLMVEECEEPGDDEE